MTPSKRRRACRACYRQALRCFDPTVVARLEIGRWMHDSGPTSAERWGMCVALTHAVERLDKLLRMVERLECRRGEP